METSVYHFAISTLLHFPGFYPVSELCFYQMVCFYFFFSSTQSSCAFLKAELHLLTQCSRSQKCGIKECIEMRLRSQAHVFTLCLQSWFCPIFIGWRNLPVHCLWQEGTVGAQSKAAVVGYQGILLLLSIILWERLSLHHCSVAELVCGELNLIYELLQRRKKRTSRSYMILKKYVKQKDKTGVSQEKFPATPAQDISSLCLPKYAIFLPLFWKTWGVWLHLISRVILVLRYLL